MDQIQKNNPTRIFLISEDQKLPIALGSVLGPDYVLTAAFPTAKIRDKVSAEHADIMILDIDLPRDRPNSATRGNAPSTVNQPAEALFAELSAMGIPLIVMAGDESRAHAQDLVARGAHGYVRNPPVIRELKALLRTAMESRRLRQDLHNARRRMESLTGLDGLTGSSAPMQLVYKLIRKVANLDASVLISGESGTGKELISRAIHNTGTRSKRPFVAVSCSAIPETLIESELFGHEKGAFTGSNGTREGYFEQAGDGTLFLDEIGELKPNIQVKLLRVLQQREFSRLGSSRMIPLRARVILATHRDLSRMVADGLFRQDLFYRINVMNISAPELRRRASDIPVLAQHFVMKYSELFRKPVENIEPEALGLLQSYSWPGNVRELENVIQRAVIMAEGYSIEASDLPDEVQDTEVSAFEDDAQPNGTFERLLRDYKTKLAMDAVVQCKGNKTLAAQSLSISRAYLHRLIRPAAVTVDHGVTEIRSSFCA